MIRTVPSRRRAGRALAVLAAGALAWTLAGCGVFGASESAEYPDDTINMTIPYAAGGTIDPTGRQVAQALEKRLGSPVVVTNRPGGAGAVGMAEIAAAESDGYHVGFVASTDLAYQPLASDNADYEADDFLAYKVSELPALLVTKADAPWDNLDDVASAAATGSGEVHIGTAGTGTPPDLSARAWNARNGGDAAIVPFAGGGAEALRALLSDEIEVWAGYSPAVLGQVQAGDLKVIGVLDDDEYSLFPDASLPAEGAAADYVPFSMYLVVPSDVPGDVSAALRDAMETVVADDISSYLDETGQVADYQGPDSSADYLATLVPVYQELVESVEAS